MFVKKKIWRDEIFNLLGANTIEIFLEIWYYLFNIFLWNVQVTNNSNLEEKVELKQKT